MMRSRISANCLLLALLMVIAGGCGGDAAPTGNPHVPVSLPAASTGGATTNAPTAGISNAPDKAEGFNASQPATTAAMAAPTAAAMSFATAGTGGTAAYATPGDAPMRLVAPVAPVDNGVHTGKAPQPNYQSSLTAGQVDDNAAFSDYLDYLNKYSGVPIHPVDVTKRLFLRVVDGSQHPVAGARVQLSDGGRAVFDGQTTSDGRVLFFPGAANANQAKSLHAVVSRGNTKVEGDIKPGGEQNITLTGLTDNTGAVALDLVFLLDATGSMDDEIAQIKATVGSIADRIEQLPGSTAPRFGLVAFRDQGDDYITRSWDFTGSIDQFAANLDNVHAGGGGDMPESVNAGLHDAVNLPGWASNESGRHLRMIVLVGDAPPHLDYPNDYEYTSLLQDAVRKGIKIFPIGASGLDDQGEYIFRQFAQVTQGQFVFMTYANGVAGAPGLATDHHVSDFTVQNLDTLVVNLVAGEVANQTGQKPQSGGTTKINTLLAPVESTGNAIPPTHLLQTLQSTLERAAGELFSWSTVGWLVLLAGLVVVGNHTPHRAWLPTPATFKARRNPTTEEAQTETHAPTPDLAAPEGYNGMEHVAQLTVPLSSLFRDR